MTATTIPRDLSERCLEFIARNGLSYDSMRLASDIRAALSAPAGPLTADELKQLAERVRRMQLEHPTLAIAAASGNACRLLHFLADVLRENSIEHAPAWTGPQPVVDSLNGETS